MSNTHRKGSGGFTLVEVAIIILTLAIISAILVPQLGRLNALARFIRVKEDLNTVCTMLKVMLDDLGESAFYGDGTDGNNEPERGQPVGLLIGDGDTPDTPGAAGGDYAAGTNGTADGWDNPVDAEFVMTFDFGTGTETFRVDTFANQLIQNTPEGGTQADVGYTVPADYVDDTNGLNYDPDTGGGFNQMFGWRGPYLNEVTADPWGNRYMAEVHTLYFGSNGSDGFDEPAICISAGPNEAIDTAYPVDEGLTAGGDDFVVVFSGPGGVH